MRKVGLIICIFISVSTFAQVAKPLQFKEESFDFGKVVEKDGPVTHVFEFTNSHSKPVKILGVKPSCGCTTPDWSKEEIQPGNSGFIKAEFNPKGRPGFFNKTLTVTTDAEHTQIILQIKGSVVSDVQKIASQFDGARGSWRVKSSSLNLGKIFIKNEYVVREFQLMNGGKKAVSYLGRYDGPTYIRVNVEPKVLQPGEIGIIRIGYNGKLRNAYGFQSDNVVIHTDDESEPAKSFDVLATLEDFFPELTPQEAAKAAKLQLNQTALDFGRIKQNQTTAREVTVTNLGQSLLELRSIQGNCTCITTEVNKQSLKTGQSATIRISFNPQDRKGTQQKSVMIYSNDPKDPVQRIVFTAYSE
jgi:archaellum component FlaF (FlaF/FlaG flagellin family)